MEDAGLHKDLKTGIWPECVAITTKLGNIMVNPNKEKCSYKKFYSKIPDYAKHLNTFGELGVVRIIVNVKFKLDC